MPEFNLLQKIIIWLIPTLFAITLHEVAHGFMAYRLGDPTAKLAGRLTLNPIKHVDWIGTLILPTLLYIMGGFIFGWAKPVPVDWRNLRKPKRDTALVAIAGPLANLLMAILWALTIKFGFSLHDYNSNLSALLIYLGIAGVSINAILIVLNLLPIPPLDGSRVLNSFLSPHASLRYNQLEPYGFIILLILLVTGLLSHLMMPVVAGLQALLINHISGI